MKILVLGRNGQVGSELEQLARRSHQGWEWCFAARSDCDLASPEAVRKLLRRIRPAILVNAAAYTAVDRAETERDLCFSINAHGPAILGEEAKGLDALLIHYSTDYVFDGQKPSPYIETDATHPLNIYGESKLAGESAILASGCRFLILRTSWVYCARGRNFLRTMLRLGAERPELKIVDDQRGAPTSAAAIAQATAKLIGREAAGEAPGGLYHMSAAGSTTWYGFAQAIFSGGEAHRPRLLPIPGAEYPTPAQRPANSILSNDNFANAFGFRMAPWQDQLAEVLSEIRKMSQPA